MDNRRAEELYGQILSSAQKIRTEIMSGLADTLSFGGNIPASDSEELQTAAYITGHAFAALAKRGFKVEEVPGRSRLIKMEADGGTYTCSKAALPGGKQEPPVIVKSADLNKKSEETATKVPDIPVKEEIPNTPAFFENPTESCQQKESQKEEPVPAKEPEENAEPQPPLKEAEEPLSSLSTLEEKESSKEAEPLEKEPESGFQPESAKESIPLPIKATVIGGEPVVQTIEKADIFMEEKRKAGSEFVFDTYRISVAHGEMGGGGRAEEMFVMIAPLKIQRFSCPSVPILVSIYYKGRMYSKSSYDSSEDGKNLVNIDVNEYYFLCRGSFDEEGKFQSTIVTTGLSSDQRDILSVMSREKHGSGKNAKNGHIKFRYEAEEGQGVIEVFPLEIGEMDFVIVARNAEFIDYLYITENVKGLSRAIVYELGVKKEVVCNWDGDFLEVDLLEV